MDERLIHYYNIELGHLREMGAEFAREFPKVAARLGLDPDGRQGCPDPYVERLLEGFAFLAARVHLKLDAEFPRFTQAIFETVYPHYLSPTPAMAMVRFEPDEKSGDELAKGLVVPRGTLLRSNLGKGERTACTFRTGHPVRLLPVRLSEVRYFTRDLGELNLPAGVSGRAAFRIRLQSFGGLPFEQIQLDPITFLLGGADERPGQIYEQIFAAGQALVLQDPAQQGKTIAQFPASSLRQVGFGLDESLLPPSPRGFEGYRLLREYFAFPQRFLFFALAGFGEGLRRCRGDRLDLVIVLKTEETRLEGRVDRGALELGCTPVINLFPKALDRIPLDHRSSEFQVVPDRHQPLDFEVFEIQSVRGYGFLAGEEQEFRPFYLVRDTDTEGAAFYTTHRVPRVLTEKEKKFGKKSGYSGSELYLSLVDARAAPYRPELKQLGVQALCTNRPLPIQMGLGSGPTDFTIVEQSAPVVSVRCVGTPTLPRPSPVEGRYAWRLISHLSLNYLSLAGAEGKEEAGALQDLLKLYVPPADRGFQRQVQGLRAVRTRPIVRRVETPGPITFARGLEITVTLDETAFEGVGIFILGAVLEQFFARYVALNSFTETVIHSQQRGEIMRWPAQVGRQPIL
jgi:type VI secretion system protein ImpG